MVKVVKYFLLFLLTLFILTVSCFVLEAFNVKKGANYDILKKYRM